MNRLGWWLRGITLATTKDARRAGRSALVWSAEDDGYRLSALGAVNGFLKALHLPLWKVRPPA